MKPLLETLEDRITPSSLSSAMNAYTMQVYQNLQQEVTIYQQDFNGSPPPVIQLQQGQTTNGYLFPGNNGEYYGPIGNINDTIHNQVQAFFNTILPLYLQGQLDSQDVQTGIQDGQTLQAIQQIADDYMFTFAFYEQQLI